MRVYVCVLSFGILARYTNINDISVCRHIAVCDQCKKESNLHNKDFCCYPCLL